MTRALTKEEASDLIYEEQLDGENYHVARPKRMIDQSRWSISYEVVLEKVSDGTFWMVDYRRGSTEYQDEGIEDATMYQVWPHETVIVTYSPAPPKGKEMAVARSAD